MKLHKEGTKIIRNYIIGLTIITSVGLNIFGLWALSLIIPLVVLFGFVLWFFRVPERKIDLHSAHVIAPVDGKVVMIKEVDEPEFLKQKMMQISIFMSPLNVHICRFPVSGKIIYKKYHPGKYLVAWHEKSSTENERTTMVVETPNNTKVLFRQIAGYVARRIVFYPEVGQNATAGTEYGFIKFGSRMDVFLPIDAEINVKIGDIAVGGEDVIAKFKK